MMSAAGEQPALSAVSQRAKAGLGDIKSSREAVGRLPPGRERDALEKQLAQLDEAQASLTSPEQLARDPEKMTQWLNSIGILPEEVDAAQNAPDPQAALQQLAERAMRRGLASSLGDDASSPRIEELVTGAQAKPQSKKAAKAAKTLAAQAAADAKAAEEAKAAKRAEVAARVAEAKRQQQAQAVEVAEAVSRAGGAIGGGGSGGGRKGKGGSAAGQTAASVAAQLAQLEATKAKMAEMQAAVEQAKQSTAETSRQVQKASAELASAEQQKKKHGKAVDEAVAAAAVDLDATAKRIREEAALRGRVVSDLRERGNQAMQRGELSAALALYIEALEVPEMPPEERVKILGNRAALHMAESRAKLALADAEEAAELGYPGITSAASGKAHYRLGCAREASGDAAGAVAALRKAVELMPGAGEVEAKLRAVELTLPKRPEEAAAGEKESRAAALERAAERAAKRAAEAARRGSAKFVAEMSSAAIEAGEAAEARWRFGV